MNIEHLREFVSEEYLAIARTHIPSNKSPEYYQGLKDAFLYIVEILCSEMNQKQQVMAVAALLILLEEMSP